MAGRQVKIELVGDSSDLERALSSSARASSSWSKKLKSAGKVAGLGIAAGVGIAAVALEKSADAGKEAEVSQKRMEAQLKASVPGWKK